MSNGITAMVQRYVDILTEAGFKAVFGVEKNKDILIDLLNVLLPEHRRVHDLSYATTEIPGFTMANKTPKSRSLTGATEEYGVTGMSPSTRSGKNQPGSRG